MPLEVVDLMPREEGRCSGAHHLSRSLHPRRCRCFRREIELRGMIRGCRGKRQASKRQCVLYFCILSITLAEQSVFNLKAMPAQQTDNRMAKV